MIWVPLIINVFIAAVLGAGTNYLAIKGLFRPHRKTLFWQGVIPKRIDALAASIGNLVERDLLTDNVVRDILLSDDAKTFFETLVVDGLVDGLQRDERTLKELLVQWADLPPDVLEEKVPPWVEERIVRFLHREETAQAVTKWLDAHIHQWWNSPVRGVTESEYYMPIRYGLREVIRSGIETGVLRQQLMAVVKRYLEEYESSPVPLRQIIPAHLQKTARRLILAEGPVLADQLVAYVQSPEVKRRLEAGIEDVINSFGWLAQTVAHYYNERHDLAGRAVATIVEFLEDPANQKQLANKLLEYMDMLLSRSVGDVIRFVGRDNLVEASQWVVDKMVSMQSADALMDSLDRFLRSEGERTWKDLFSSLKAYDNGATPRDGGPGDGGAVHPAPIDPSEEALAHEPLSNHHPAEPAPYAPEPAHHAEEPGPSGEPGPSEELAQHTGEPGRQTEAPFRPAGEPVPMAGPGVQPPGAPAKMLHAAVRGAVRSQAVERLVHTAVNQGWEHVLSLKPAHYARNIRVNDLKQLKRHLVQLYERLVTSHAVDAVKQLPIGAHVTQHLLSLDLEEVEKLIVRVLGRELAVITWMGGVIGAVVGVGMFFIQRWFF